MFGIFRNLANRFESSGKPKQDVIKGVFSELNLSDTDLIFGDSVPVAHNHLKMGTKSQIVVLSWWTLSAPLAVLRSSSRPWLVNRKWRIRWRQDSNFFSWYEFSSLQNDYFDGEDIFSHRDLIGVKQHFFFYFENI